MSLSLKTREIGDFMKLLQREAGEKSARLRVDQLKVETRLRLKGKIRLTNTNKANYISRIV